MTIEEKKQKAEIIKPIMMTIGGLSLGLTGVKEIEKRMTGELSGYLSLAIIVATTVGGYYLGKSFMCKECPKLETENI